MRDEVNRHYTDYRIQYDSTDLYMFRNSIAASQCECCVYEDEHHTFNTTNRNLYRTKTYELLLFDNRKYEPHENL